APDELPKVFEKFFRSTDTRVLKQTGTGLGLSMAREVVRLHGGDITVVSEFNKGSAFTVTLPIPARYTMFAIEKQGAVDVIRCGAALQKGSLGALTDALQGCARQGQPHVVLDLAEAPLIDGKG